MSPAKVKLMPPPAKELVTGFAHFIGNYGVIPLAIGVVIGNAVNDFVKSLVDGLLTPLISLVTPEGRLQNFQLTFHGAVFKVGAVVSSLLTFLLIALVVYIVVKLLLRNEELLQKK